MEPLIEPLGFDWKMGVSLLTGVAAKEVVVSTMEVLYADQGQEHAAGFTPWVAFGFMLFILLYFPCVAVIAAIRKEAGWKWALWSIFYTTTLAWVVAYLVRLMSYWWGA